MHGGQLLIQLSLTRILQGRQKVDVLVHDIVRTPEGLGEHNVLEYVNRFGRNIGLLIELAKGTVQITFAPDASSFGKSPLWFDLFGSLVICQLLNV